MTRHCGSLEREAGLSHEMTPQGNDVTLDQELSDNKKDISPSNMQIPSKYDHPISHK